MKTNKSTNKQLSFFYVIILFPICIFIGKFLRYNWMKSILVDTGIGNKWIWIIDSNLQAAEILNMTIAGEQNGAAILFYKFFNIFALNTYLQFEIIISIIFNIIVFILFFKCKKELNLYQIIFLLTTIILLNLFCFCLSKEPIQILFFIIIYYILLSKKNNKEFWTLVIVLLSALLFRKYYIMIAYFFVETKIIIKCINESKVKKSFVRFILIIVLLSLGYLLVLFVSKRIVPSYYAEFIRVRTRTGDAATTIKNLTNSNNLLLFMLNYLLIVLRMLFPLELILKGPKYILYVFYQLMVSYSFIKSMFNYKNNNKIKNISLLLYISFLFTSAMFEPDFGSWVRHEVALFPILLIMNNITTKKYDDLNTKK